MWSDIFFNGVHLNASHGSMFSFPVSFNCTLDSSAKSNDIGGERSEIVPISEEWRELPNGESNLGRRGVPGDDLGCSKEDVDNVE